MLHLNNGLDKGVKFSEVGQLSGIHQTEWSWSPLFADFDNDGYKDAMITNGFPKDITDKDFANYRADVGNVASNALLIDSIPVIKIPNYAYKNNGDLTFTDVTLPWGMGTPSFSNGAAFADLDNDGDLDYVVNNINDKAFVYENTLYAAGTPTDSARANYLRVELRGTPGNQNGVGSKIWVYHDSDKVQFAEQFAYRGFLSSVEEHAHFGLGPSTKFDSVVVQWPDGIRTMVGPLRANRTLVVDRSRNISTRPAAAKKAPANRIYQPATSDLNMVYLHEEDDKIDYNLQRTLPHKFSQAGPGLSVGDVNGDGLDDVLVGGSTAYKTMIFVQQRNGRFISIREQNKDESKIWEDEGLLLFDADNDGDNDLYIVSGSLESEDPAVYQDRFLRNDGTGKFTWDKEALPVIKGSGSAVRAADFDADGDLDLFVGGRIVPGAYPVPGQSYILRNDGGSFSDVTQQVAPAIASIGMVTDGLWSDFNGDGKVDLIVVGEFMPVTFFVNDGASLSRAPATGLEGITGWWNSITGGDFDNDGDTDYVVGNLGLNNSYQVKREYPIKLIAKDFDGNGSIDPVLACYMRESMNSDVRKLYPVHFWDELNSQSPKFRNKYSRYRQYSMVTMDQVFTPEELDGAIIMEANEMASSYIENRGDGVFVLRALPMLAQVAPVLGMITSDVNNDGNLDLMLVGNDYGNEVFSGRLDALTGLVLLGKGDGSFSVKATAETGFYVGGDAKALVKLYLADQTEVIVASQNRDSLAVFRRALPQQAKVLPIGALDAYAMVERDNGGKYRVEFYYGSGYLSQSTRKLVVPAGSQVTVVSFDGSSRTITP
jgi:hypothetical protein